MGLMQIARLADTVGMFRIVTWSLVFLALMNPSPLRAQSDEGPVGIFPDLSKGRVTASGEVYDPTGLTGGSPDFRLGLRLAVTNPANRKVITIRVTDHNASPSGVLLTVSQAAADALGVTAGDKVQVRALRADQPDVFDQGTVKSPVPAATPPPEPKATSPETVSPAWVQLGAFRTTLNAQRLAESLGKQGFEPRIRHQGVVFRVYLPVPDGDVTQLMNRLTALGRRGFLQLDHEPGGDLVPLTTP